MQIEEKLKVFRQSVLEVAQKESQSVLAEYEEGCARELDSFRQNKQAETEQVFQIEETKIRRQMNREVSEEMTRQKRVLDECQQEKKQKLFEQVEKQLEQYQKTEAYDEYLAAKIRMAKQFAREEDVIIYIDPKDAEKKEDLERKTGAVLTVSEIRFGGGIRAVIRSKNVLIDESFDTRMIQERNAYTF